MLKTCCPKKQTEKVQQLVRKEKEQHEDKEGSI